MKITIQFWFGVLFTLTLVSWGIWIGVGYAPAWKPWLFLATFWSVTLFLCVVGAYLEE